VVLARQIRVAKVWAGKTAQSNGKRLAESPMTSASKRTRAEQGGKRGKKIVVYDEVAKKKVIPPINYVNARKPVFREFHALTQRLPPAKKINIMHVKDTKT